MREEIAAVARFQSRLEMLMRNLTLKIDGSDLRVRTFEEQQQTIKQWQNELDKQRTQQQMLHSEAQAVARRFGLAPEIVDADDMDILLLPSGRDYSALASAITRLRQAKQILEASEIKISKERLMQTLPPKDSVR
ncbi:MAG: hypothetical protein QOE70_4464 [Chthoniobacter sp.]|nr:hypothetical protein [Chthoniobacter sp.]